MRTIHKLVVLATLAVPACYAASEPAYVAGVTYEGPAQPELVEAEPGLQVIADYPEPIFFVDGFYYHQSGGRWYRARDYHRGWETARGGVPSRLSRVEHPERYRHYRPTRTHQSRR
jgi:hypothetical protein